MTFETKCSHLNKKEIPVNLIRDDWEVFQNSWSAKVLFCVMNFLYLRPISLRNTCEKSSLLLNINMLAPCNFPITLILCAYFTRTWSYVSNIGILHKHYLVDIRDSFQVLIANWMGNEVFQKSKAQRSTSVVASTLS